VDPDLRRLLEQAEEALRKAEEEPDDKKALALLDEAAKRLVAWGTPPRDVLQRVREAMKSRSAQTTIATTATGAKKLPDEIEKKMKKAGLPTGGSMPFKPQIDKNKKGEPIIRKREITHGPMKGKKGYVDTDGKIWIRDRAHGKYPDHWDVQENGGKKGRTRIGQDGEPIP
jgi:hypothetical protein